MRLEENILDNNIDDIQEEEILEVKPRVRGLLLACTLAVAFTVALPPTFFVVLLILLSIPTILTIIGLVYYYRKNIRSYAYKGGVWICMKIGLFGTILGLF